MSDRRAFWPPGEVHEATESFCIRDASGQALAYVYYENEKGRLPTAAAALASASDRPAINVVAAEVLLASASRWPPTHFALCRSDLCPGLSMRQVDGALVLSKHPWLTPFQLKTVLYLCAHNVAEESGGSHDAG